MHVAEVPLAERVAAQWRVFAASFRAWPLVIYGVLKIIYDLLLLMQLRHLKPPEER